MRLIREISLADGPALRQKSPALRELTDRRIRNLVRGALTSKNAADFKKTMERLRRESELHDAALAFQYLEDSPLSYALAKPTSFPVSTGTMENLPFFGTASLPIELAPVGLRLARDADRLCAAIDFLAKLNERILARDTVGASACFAQFRERFGLSLLVAGKAMSARHASADDGGRKDFGDVIAPFLSPRRQVAAVAFEDSVDPGRGYIHVRRSFMRFVSENRLRDYDVPIVVDLLSPLAEQISNYSQRLQAYGRWSLIDVTAYLFRLRHILDAEGRGADVSAIDAVIPEAVRTAWTSSFDAIDVDAYQSLVGGSGLFADSPMFAHASAWSEYPEIFEYRLRVERAIGLRLDGRFPLTRTDAATMAEPCADIRALLLEGPAEVGIHSVAPGVCGVFHRTIALIASLENGGLGEVDGAQLATLLDQTSELPHLLTRAELDAFLPRRSGDLLYEYLRTALIADIEANKVSNHGIRRALERLVSAQFEGDIVKLLEHLDTPICHVASHLYHTCTEAFLTELYGLFKEADQVTEAQASILEWYGSRQADDDAISRAKSHRLNLRLRKVRGAIEETRIYVDPLRFTEWVQENIGSELRILGAEVDDIIADTDRSTSLKDPLRVAIQPRLKLLKLLDQCYAEFCTNKIYGVTAFIGRRIRHGTLHGHLVLEFQPEILRAAREFEQCAPRFAEFLLDWLRRFDAAVVQIVTDQIHVRSKDKPKGVIVATLDEADKAAYANIMLNEVAASMSESHQIARSVALIREYCWVIFEVDLKRARDAVERLRRTFVIDVESCRTNDIHVDRRISERVRALNSSLQQRFEGVRSWFTRPTNVSPSANLEMLFAAVVDEVRQRHPGFEPQIERAVAQEVDLIGHRFHFFYDALYILVHNAARHGKQRGLVKIEATLNLDDEKYTDLSVAITSELESENLAGRIELIELAMNAEIGDATLANKQSGIRKLRSLVENVTEIIGFNRQYDGDRVIFTIEMRYPRS